MTRCPHISQPFFYAKYAGAASGKESAQPDFADMDNVSIWALDGLRYCADAGIISGKPAAANMSGSGRQLPPEGGNLFDPQAGAARAEAAAMLHRFILSMAAGEAVPAGAASDAAAAAGTAI
jgi:hypothetical protein